MSSFSRQAASRLTPALLAFLSLLAFSSLFTAGCTPSSPPPPSVKLPVSVGVTANSGGDTRGTILYRTPAHPLIKPPLDPYEAVSSKFVIGERQKMAWALAELDDHAHLAAVHAYPVPDPSWKGYDKEKSLAQARRQALFNAYLLEKYRARFCNQFHLTYDQMKLIIQESRLKNWPMPVPPGE